jgi:hypothetical protein
MKFVRSFVNVNPVLKSFYGAIVFSSPIAEKGNLKMQKTMKEYIF